MQKVVYELRDNSSYWTVAQFVPFPKSEIILLFMSLHPIYDWIMVDEKNDQVVIWDSFDLRHDPWEKISKLYLSKKNYKQIVQLWNQNAENPAPYIIFSRDNLGWINVEAKLFLSEDDFNVIEQDKKAKLENGGYG